MSSILADHIVVVNEPNCGVGEVAGVTTYKYSCAHGAQVNFGDLTPFINLWSECKTRTPKGNILAEAL
jgi:hypothetical protein